MLLAAVLGVGSCGKPATSTQEQLDHEVPRISSRVAGVPGALGTLVEDCLCQNSWERIPSASVFVRRISEIRAALPPPVPAWA